MGNDVKAALVSGLFLLAIAILSNVDAVVRIGGAAERAAGELLRRLGLVALSRAVRQRWKTLAATGAALSMVALTLAFVDPRPERCSGPSIPLEVNASIDKDDLLVRLALAYNQEGRVFAGHCALVSVHGTSSGVARQALASSA